MKRRTLSFLVVCGLLAGSSLCVRAIEAGVQANATVNAGLPSGAAPEFSGGCNDVVKLAKSGVDESVVVSYIKASPGPFQPSAEEIIKMRDAGVSSTVISAMLQRQAEVRTESIAAASQTGAAAQAPVITDTAPQGYTASQAETVPPETPPAGYYGDSGSSVTYVGGYPYPYYPYYSGFISTAFFYPFPCWFGGSFFPHGCFFPHGGFVHDNFHQHDGFHSGFHGSGFAHGGFNGGFHGSGSVHGSFNGGFHGGFSGHNGFVGTGFHGNNVNSGFHSGFVGSGFHGSGMSGGFHSSGAPMGSFHGGGGMSMGGMHGGGMGGGFHGGGGHR